MLPKKNSKRETVAFRVDSDAWKFIQHLKNDKFIDVSSWLRSVVDEAIEKVKAKGGEVSYGASEKH